MGGAASGAKFRTARSCPEAVGTYPCVAPVLQRYRQRKVQEQQEAAQQLSGRVEQAVEGLGGWVSMGELCEAGALEEALGG